MDAGGTRFKGLFVMEYVTPPMVIAVVEKVTTPVPELLAVKVPLKVAEKLSLPATGTVCVMVKVKVPEILIAPVPDTNVWKFPKLEPVGVLRLVEPRPVKVIMTAFPMPPKKVTEFVPLPAQPTHVKVPDVEKVTGSALTTDVAKVNVTSSNTLIRVALMKCDISLPSFQPWIPRPHIP